jgi:hypothetical protein
LEVQIPNGRLSLKDLNPGIGPHLRSIEAITADGCALTPDIIFKGKELQQQWFLKEFRQTANWYYITSPKGWTDDHIAVEYVLSLNSLKVLLIKRRILG